ncbi:MAG: hypothetical protein ABSG03_09815 [Bryobacteraceae bacterium]
MSLSRAWRLAALQSYFRGVAPVSLGIYGDVDGADEVVPQLYVGPHTDLASWDGCG